MYVAASRGRDHLDIITDDVESLENAIQRSIERAHGVDVAKDAHVRELHANGHEMEVCNFKDDILQVPAPRRVEDHRRLESPEPDPMHREIAVAGATPPNRRPAHFSVAQKMPSSEAPSTASTLYGSQPAGIGAIQEVDTGPGPAGNPTNRNEQIVADHFGPPSTIPNGVSITTSVLPSVPSSDTETAVPRHAAEEKTRKLGYETPLESATTDIASIAMPKATDHAKRFRAPAPQGPAADTVRQQTTPEDWTTNDSLSESSIQMVPDNDCCADEFVRNEEVAASDFGDNSFFRGPPPIPEDDEAPKPEASRSNTPLTAPAWSVEFDEPDALHVDDDMLLESISLDDVDIDTVWPEPVPQPQTSSEHSSNMPQPHFTAEVTPDLGDNSQILERSRSRACEYSRRLMRQPGVRGPR